MTIEKVKKDLPEVTLIWNGKRYSAKISGRLNPFASVYGRKTVKRGKTTYVMPFPATPDFQFAWETIARAITNNKPIRA
jgi:hypothetical protein